jgi:hypothetical protein
MDAGVAVERPRAEAGLGILTQSGMPARAPAQRRAPARWLSTFTCG